jgi:hypothetical protein
VIAFDVLTRKVYTAPGELPGSNIAVAVWSPLEAA